MAGGLLTFDAVSDRERLEGLVGQEIEAGAVVGIRRTVFYALDPAIEGQAVADLPHLNPAWFSGEIRQSFVETVVESGDTFLVSITPVISIDGGTPAFSSTSKSTPPRPRLRKTIFAGCLGWDRGLRCC